MGYFSQPKLSLVREQARTVYGFGVLQISGEQFYTITGTGILHWVIFSVAPETASHGVNFNAKIDGMNFWSFFGSSTSGAIPSYENLEAAGFDTGTVAMKLLEYTINGRCTALYDMNNGVLFKNQLILMNKNKDVRAYDTFMWFYVEGNNLTITRSGF